MAERSNADFSLLDAERFRQEKAGSESVVACGQEGKCPEFCVSSSRNMAIRKAVLGTHCTYCFFVNKLSDIYLSLSVNYTNYNWNYNRKHIKHIIKLLGNK